MKIKSQNNQSKLIFDWKYSSILNCYTKSIGKFPKKFVLASFLQCSVYIVLGQDDWLRKIHLKVLWNDSVRRIRQSIVNMEVPCPLHIFPWKP